MKQPASLYQPNWKPSPPATSHEPRASPLQPPNAVLDALGKAAALESLRLDQRALRLKERLGGARESIDAAEALDPQAQEEPAPLRGGERWKQRRPEGRAKEAESPIWRSLLQRAGKSGRA